MDSLPGAAALAALGLGENTLDELGGSDSVLSLSPATVMHESPVPDKPTLNLPWEKPRSKVDDALSSLQAVLSSVR